LLAVIIILTLDFDATFLKDRCIAFQCRL